MSEYLKREETRKFPRIPLEGSLDLTYRCNNNCRHCWLRIPAGSSERKRELSLDEIKKIVDEARSMGCRRWSISGGEPMLRPDFREIFDYIASKCASYSLNTNGTMITPQISGLMKQKGSKMVALYGATAEVHDHITRTPGSFEATMQGFAYLKQAGAGFIVQLIPMRDNYHQLDDMIRLAGSLSRHWRIGASWLYLSASGEPKRNQEIMRQRLDPKQVVELDKPDVSYEESTKEGEGHYYECLDEDDRLFASCIGMRRDFHIDPYGQMTFCSFVQAPGLRYDLRKGTFKECWEEFLPSLVNTVRGGEEYLENCGSCELKEDCLWCPVYGYLEHQSFSARVEYLCDVARENRKFKDNWKEHHRRYYEIAGITIQVESDHPITDDTFHPKFELFEVDGPGEDTISIRHHFSLPDLNGRNLGEEIYRMPPWAIYKKGKSWIYTGISPDTEDKAIHCLVLFNYDHTRARIYNDNVREESFRKGGVHSLTLFPTDQILLARVLADRGGCYLHSSGVILDGKGLLFVGHSDAGKSTMVTMLKDKSEILCDDRMIVRKWGDGFRIHGTWSHGDIPEVSSASAPLKALLFLEQANENRLISLDNRREIISKLFACLIKPFVTADWWEKMLTLVGQMARELPCYNLHFDKTGEVVDVLDQL
jgi:MoaA/NifB/PqqE/SkfB family radical SAM enzyme